ncbi:hypothetical protein [Virgibacillus pantothenticus]|uniref:Lipoprotein n=1 Tax=Virgibacillus pantothenticus TaxID=1473 RepID=A0A0L0QLD4_VIRPA|nr:hypothetical protein [Virgibacillus pantothenticus]KNE19053.1 hypothetical protein AFK71_10855 [Virgibacillus pantothenticus]MED3738964.1 hypothetical protein [Virgibacillus pantothenticus]QTY15495.1 hypothetical protein KBP50_16620 [Virgibacillus pantothenticus]SIT16673.1 hypothetical protein SAMN05421787_12722 [Virgibacillus pantothenticus]
MRKVLLIVLFLISIFILASCQTEQEKEQEVKNEERNKAITTMEEKLDAILAADSFTRVWDIEDHILYDEEIDEENLFMFTDDYIMDQEKFESLNQEEQNLVMSTGVIINKFLNDEYKDKSLLEDDVKEYYEVLKTGEGIMSELGS